MSIAQFIADYVLRKLGANRAQVADILPDLLGLAVSMATTGQIDTTTQVQIQSKLDDLLRDRGLIK